MAILVVDDEAGVRFALGEVLEEAGYDVCAVASAAEAQHVLTDRAAAVEVVLTDLVMEGMDGMALLTWCREQVPTHPVILMTARGSERIAVQALKSGAYDYLSKPFDVDAVVATVSRAVEAHALRRNKRTLAVERAVGHAVIADSEPMQRLLAAVERVAPRDVTVLVGGETGTGKELVGTLLHAWSPHRSARPLIRFNCAAITETLAESELFGHTKGAFTGAVRDRIGYLQRADGGTLILDEVGELSPAIQAKLLRVIQEGEVQPVGGSRIARVDVRIVACTHRNLTEEVKAGRFRADLYYRLAVVEFTVPPLRHRPEDIPALLELFRRRYAERFGVEDVHFSPRLCAEFQQRPWPGNVRELENTVARLIALSPGGEIDRAPDMGAHTYGSETMAPATYRALMNSFERQILEQALARCDGNRSAAARQLDMSRTTLMDKLKRHGLIA